MEGGVIEWHRESGIHLRLGREASMCIADATIPYHESDAICYIILYSILLPYYAVHYARYCSDLCCGIRGLQESPRYRGIASNQTKLGHESVESENVAITPEPSFIVYSYPYSIAVKALYLQYKIYAIHT